MKTEINPQGVRDRNIRLHTLRLATAADLNRTNAQGQLEKHIGQVFWWDVGKPFGQHLLKFHLTGDKYQTAWVREYLGKRIYVIK